MTTTALEVAARRLPEPVQIELALGLPENAIQPNGLSLTNPDTTFEEWQQYGHTIGALGRWHRFALGDWLLFGEALFGEDAAQAVESTAAERYDVAHRVTGLQVATLQNYASLCGRIPLSRRRVELDFSTHEPVASLDAEEQEKWLELAVENGWDRAELRQAIKDAKNPSGPVDEDDPGPVPDATDITATERALAVLRQVFERGQPTSDGGAYIPAETWAQVAASLGEE